MRKSLIDVITQLNPSVLNLNKMNLDSFKKLGIGEGNLNYLFNISGKKFICRININKNNPTKTRREYAALKSIEKARIAPMAYYLHNANKYFPNDFVILQFIEGKSLRMKKRSYTQNQIKQIAVILAKLHNIKATKQSKSEYTYKQGLRQAKVYLDVINKDTKGRFRPQFTLIHKKIREFIPKKEVHMFGMIHSDVCPQNIVESNNELKLIDWESLKYSDPAKDISTVMIDMGLKNENLNLFLDEYHKIRKDESILDRARIYAVLMTYHYFLWELVRSYEIMRKELPKEYLVKTSAKRHFNEARHQFKNLKKLIKLPEVKIDKVFK